MPRNHASSNFLFSIFLVPIPYPRIQLSQARKSSPIKIFRSRRISILWSTQVHGLICKPADQKSSASKSRTVKYPRFSQGPITELYSWWPTDRDLNNQVVFKIFVFIFYSWEHLITLARRLLEKIFKLKIWKLIWDKWGSSLTDKWLIDTLIIQGLFCSLKTYSNMFHVRNPRTNGHQNFICWLLFHFGPTIIAGPDFGRSKIPFLLVLVQIVQSENFWPGPSFWKAFGDWWDGKILVPILDFGLWIPDSHIVDRSDPWPRSRWFSNLIDRRITITGHITWFLFSFLFLRRSFEVDFISRKGLIRITVRHAG